MLDGKLVRSRHVEEITRIGHIYNCVRLRQFTGEEFDLIAEGRVPVEQDHVFTLNPTTPAADAVTGFAEQFFRPHGDIHPLGARDEILEARFLMIFCLCHCANLKRLV